MDVSELIHSLPPVFMVASLGASMFFVGVVEVGATTAFYAGAAFAAISLATLLRRSRPRSRRG